MRRAAFGVWAVVLGAGLAACRPQYVEGRVTDVRGAALPGVIVRVAGGAGAQDLTDAVGHYRVVVTPASARVDFSKTGYTSAAIALASAGARSTVLSAASLWPLPLKAGVYTVNDKRFFEMSFVVPKPFYLKDGTTAYGAELPKEIPDAAGDPFIVAYRTSRYNARLSRLTASETKADAASGSIGVWVEAGTMAAALEPVDAPPEGQQPQLLRVQVGRPLEPGVYGVHWGALEGYTTLDARVFVFRIPEPPAAENAPAAEAAKVDAETAPGAAVSGEKAVTGKKAADPAEKKSKKSPEAPAKPGAKAVEKSPDAAKKPVEKSSEKTIAAPKGAAPTGGAAEKKTPAAPPADAIEPTDAPVPATPAKP